MRMEFIDMMMDRIRFRKEYLEGWHTVILNDWAGLSKDGVIVGMTDSKFGYKQRILHKRRITRKKIGFGYEKMVSTCRRKRWSTHMDTIGKAKVWW